CVGSVKNQKRRAGRTACFGRSRRSHYFQEAETGKNGAILLESLDFPGLKRCTCDEQFQP
ncbi:MAG: hypothetical protein ACI83E_000579, partial [Sulfitobacter sp.]